MISSRLKLILAPVLISLIFLAAIPSCVECKKAAPASSSENEHEPTIEEVSSKQLEKILLEKDYVAVYWCKWRGSCVCMCIKWSINQLKFNYSENFHSKLRNNEKISQVFATSSVCIYSMCRCNVKNNEQEKERSKKIYKKIKQEEIS